jgi:acetyl-CoA carboxylase carboxyl transferase subunit beta
MEYAFIGGSMGVVVGEKITRGIERAHRRALPVVIVCCSGGARMMEGALSLMQMAKICGALARLDRARLPYISVLTDPTTGGVTASLPMLGDLKHRRAQGAHRLRRTARHRADDPQKLPEGFQRSEFLLEKGHARPRRRSPRDENTIANALRFMGTRAQLRAGRHRGRRADP